MESRWKHTTCRFCGSDCGASYLATNSAGENLDLPEQGGRYGVPTAMRQTSAISIHFACLAW
ncbi:hypothetical protein QFZ49_005354 [Streptomyces turgidiscabies]|uniref:4Fe-4S Mo/W bis-MGD-type domain-containing protein n=1 Tax=Streptomyces turgidiscabies TaxID=85558 RepID=A0ABU0RTR0_9ACTN|nr:hypothetical protein [Streptomyces turgidiscabies]